MTQKRWGRPVDPELGPRIRARREELGLSQREAVVGLSFTAAYLSRIENGDRQPTLNVIRELAGPLQCSPSWLEKGMPDPAELLEVSFVPEAIRSEYAHTIREDVDELAEFVEQADEALLLRIGHAAVSDDRLWITFNEVLDDAVREHMPVTVS